MKRVKLPSPEIPEFANEMMQITDFKDIATILRDSGVETIWSGDSGGRDPEFVRDGLIALEGSEHMERRRLESQLFSAARLAEYERSTLSSMLDRFFAECDAHRAGDGVVTIDLVKFGLSMLVRIGASIAGLDGVESASASDRLLEFSDTTSYATNVHWSRASNEEKLEVIAYGRKMRDEFTKEFVTPSVDRRKRLLDEVRAGRLEQNELPRDVITLLLSHNREDWKGDLVVREVLIYLHASIRTSNRVLCNSVYQLVEWLAEHPEDRAPVYEAEFLRSIVNETLRLRAVLPVLLRKTMTEITLPSGQVIPAGKNLALLHSIANREESIFGDQASEFDPRREALPPGVQNYGLAFAVGSHTCIGKRVAVGGPAARGSNEEATIGTVPTILGRLVNAGLELIEGNPPIPNAASYYDEYLSFPVKLTRL